VCKSTMCAYMWAQALVSTITKRNRRNGKIFSLSTNAGGSMKVALHQANYFGRKYVTKFILYVHPHVLLIHLRGLKRASERYHLRNTRNPQLKCQHKL
jgi:hypothetical protein